MMVMMVTMMLAMRRLCDALATFVSRGFSNGEQGCMQTVDSRQQQRKTNSGGNLLNVGGRDECSGRVDESLLGGAYVGTSEERVSEPKV